MKNVTILLLSVLLASCGSAAASPSPEVTGTQPLQSDWIEVHRDNGDGTYWYSLGSASLDRADPKAEVQNIWVQLPFPESGRTWNSLFQVHCRDSFVQPLTVSQIEADGSTNSVEPGGPIYAEPGSLVDDLLSKVCVVN